jgi:hypothetical protein
MPAGPTPDALPPSTRPRTAVKILIVIFVGIYIFLVITGRISPSGKLGLLEYVLIAFVALFVADFFDKVPNFFNSDFFNRVAEISIGKVVSVRMKEFEDRQAQTENTLNGVQIAL